MSDFDRLEKFVAYEALTGCWLWLGKLSDKNYGHATINNRTLLAHRAIYTLLVGAIPDGLQLDHLCRNPPCVNPAHLDPKTGAANNARSCSPTALNARKTHCVAGHEFTEENTRLIKHGRACRICQREQQQLRRAR